MRACSNKHCQNLLRGQLQTYSTKRLSSDSMFRKRLGSWFRVDMRYRIHCHIRCRKFCDTKLVASGQIFSAYAYILGTCLVRAGFPSSKTIARLLEPCMHHYTDHNPKLLWLLIHPHSQCLSGSHLHFL